MSDRISHHPQSQLLFAGLVVTAAILSSCAVSGPHGAVTTVVEAGAEFQELSGIGGRSRAARKAEPWWKSFNDRVLDKLIREALGKNFSLEAAGARIAQADAALRQAGGRLFPMVDAGGSYIAQWTDDGSPTDESTRLGALLDWELDVWGRLRSARKARELERDASVADFFGARVLLSASVAETYFEILEQESQLRLLEEQIETGQTLLDLTELRFGQAQSSVVDVLQQRVQLAATETLKPGVEARLRQLEYALDVLLGRTPGSGAQVRYRELQPPPALPSAGVPSELLKNRPDLIATGQRVAAIDYEVAEAIADRLPRFNLGASTAATGAPTIDTVVAGAVGSIAGPVFDAGIRKAEVARRRAELKEAIAAYSQGYLAAIRDVETALVLERKQAERVSLLANQLDIAQRLLRESRNRYSQGLTDYLPVLTAVVTEQNLQRELVTSRRELLSFRVALHRALGGPMGERSP